MVTVLEKGNAPPMSQPYNIPSQWISRASFKQDRWAVFERVVEQSQTPQGCGTNTLNGNTCYWPPRLGGVVRLGLNPFATLAEARVQPSEPLELEPESAQLGDRLVTRPPPDTSLAHENTSTKHVPPKQQSSSSPRAFHIAPNIDGDFRSMLVPRDVWALVAVRGSSIDCA